MPASTIASTFDKQLGKQWWNSAFEESKILVQSAKNFASGATTVYCCFVFIRDLMWGFPLTRLQEFAKLFGYSDVQQLNDADKVSLQRYFSTQLKRYSTFKWRQVKSNVDDENARPAILLEKAWYSQTDSSALKEELKKKLIDVPDKVGNVVCIRKTDAWGSGNPDLVMLVVVLIMTIAFSPMT